MAERLHLLVSGRVQGVGFRYGVHARAMEWGLHGWVRNLPDGRVEGLFEGDHHALTNMLDWCGHGPRFARVDKVFAEWSQATEPLFDHFTVRT